MPVRGDAARMRPWRQALVPRAPSQRRWPSPAPRCAQPCCRPPDHAWRRGASPPCGVTTCARVRVQRAQLRWGMQRRDGSQHARGPCLAPSAAAGSGAGRAGSPAAARGTGSGRGRAAPAARCLGHGYLERGGRRRPSAAPFSRSICFSRVAGCRPLRRPALALR
jgi:hypothetical protein